MHSTLLVCHACDLAHRFDPITAPARIRCVRCRAEVYRIGAGSPDGAIAWALCALVLFVLANAYPLVLLKVNGDTRLATLPGAAWALASQGYVSVAALVAFTTLLVPLAQILAPLYLLIPLRFGRAVPAQARVLRWLGPLRTWCLVEVFMLGALVALMKLSAMADVIPRVALFCYGLLMFNLAALINATPPGQLWVWMERCRR